MIVSDREALTRAFEELKARAQAEPYPALEQRRAHLAALRAGVIEAREAVAAAIDADFSGRPAVETQLAEIAPVLSAIDHAATRLARWMRPERREVSWRFWFASNRVQYQPLGVVGVLSPWNYPFNLAISPMVSALAAGNRVVLRPSSQTPRTSEAIGRMIARALPPDVAIVATGGRALADAMLDLPFDHLVFTGSTEVGRRVMRAASAHLTPVTLELGGKCPVILHPDYPLEKAVERIVFAKFLNAGQTCLAPDHVYVHRAQSAALVAALLRAIEAAYPNAVSNPEFASVQSGQRADRLRALLEDAAAKGAVIHRPAERGPAAGPQRVAPTLVSNVSEEMRLAQEEIFGPILPIFTFETVDDAFARLAEGPRPLAAYYFDRDRARIDRFLRETVSGGAAVNDALLHIAQDDLPFGGVGASGMGRYHAEEGFRTFSNARSVYAPARLNLARTLRPPWTARRRALIDKAASR